MTDDELADIRWSVSIGGGLRQSQAEHLLAEVDHLRAEKAAADHEDQGARR